MGLEILYRIAGNMVAYIVWYFGKIKLFIWLLNVNQELVLRLENKSSHLHDFFDIQQTSQKNKF